MLVHHQAAAGDHFIARDGEDRAEEPVGKLFLKPVSQSGQDRLIVRLSIRHFDEEFAPQNRQRLYIAQIGRAIGNGLPAHASDSISSGTPWERSTSCTASLPPQILGGNCEPAEMSISTSAGY